MKKRSKPSEVSAMQKLLIALFLMLPFPILSPAAESPIVIDLLEFSTEKFAVKLWIKSFDEVYQALGKGAEDWPLKLDIFEKKSGKKVFSQDISSAPQPIRVKHWDKLNNSGQLNLAWNSSGDCVVIRDFFGEASGTDILAFYDGSQFILPKSPNARQLLEQMGYHLKKGEEATADFKKWLHKESYLMTLSVFSVNEYGKTTFSLKGEAIFEIKDGNITGKPIKDGKKVTKGN